MADYVRPEQASQVLLKHGCVVAVATLKRLRCVGGGPPYTKVRGRVIYAIEDLADWAAAQPRQRRRSTSDVRGGAPEGL